MISTRGDGEMQLIDTEDGDQQKDHIVDAGERFPPKLCSVVTSRRPAAAAPHL